MDVSLGSGAGNSESFQNDDWSPWWKKWTWNSKRSKNGNCYRITCKRIIAANFLDECSFQDTSDEAARPTIAY